MFNLTKGTKMMADNGFFIFSTELASNTPSSNDFAHMLGENALKVENISFKDVDHVYKGVKERSFLVEAKHDDAVFDLAVDFGQESVLYVDPKRQAFLVYIGTGDVRPIGQFTEVAKDEALKHDAMTLDIATGKYYIVK